jgi:glycosyltransferase involved in cell wall biosynthesis
MRIGFDAKRAFNNYTGLGNHARILLNAMMRDYSNNDYYLFTTKANEKLADEIHGDYKIVLPKGRYQNTFKSLWRSRTIAKLYDEYKLDIYHGLSNELPWGKSKNSKTKTVVTIHDLIFLKHKEQYPIIDRQIYKAKTKYAAANADKVIVVSNETKNDLVNFYHTDPEKITVIYPACNPQFYTEASRETKQLVMGKYQLPEKYILHVGAFFPRKNQKNTLEAFAKIAGDVGYDLVLAGGQGDTDEEIQQLIEKHGLSSRVKIIRGISNEHMPALYQMSSLLIFPSYFEGFGAPVLEALFSKVPVITTKGGCFEEVGGKAAYYVNPSSADEIAAAIKLILSDNTLRLNMINEGIAHAGKITDAHFAAQTMQVYQSLL